jgi:hypothetical protein
MKKQINIVQTDVDTNIVDLSENQLLQMIKSDGLYSVLQNYELPIDFIYKFKDDISNLELLNIIKSGIIDIPEEYIIKFLNDEYFELEDIKDFSMKIYSNLSQVFIKEYHNYINWERMLLYLVSSDSKISIWDFENIIEEYNLWNIVSSVDLPYDFIYKWKDKLNWNILSFVKEWDDERLIVLSEYIINKNNYDE